MGCVHSRLEKQETVWRSRERKRLMKQLLACRSELAASLMSYLHSLRNTGATLRQFAEEESQFSGDSSPRIGIALPPPPPPLPPSPPPQLIAEERNAGNDDSKLKAPPISIHSLDWDFWDPFCVPSDSDSSSPVKKDDEEKWVEAKTEFEEEVEECEGGGKEKKSPSRELGGEKCSTVWRKKKTLAGIVKEIDDYFLKAAAGGGDLVVLLESSNGQRVEGNFKKTKGESLI